jgi:hypothetical protein
LSAATSSPRENVVVLVAAHGALTSAVADASRLMNAHGHGKYGAHLDHHRAELNVAIGELALWLESFGVWTDVDVARGLHSPASGEPPSHISLSEGLLEAREILKARRGNLLTVLASARSALGRAGLPADELTAYRRIVRLWAGEAIDVVASVHRLALADRYIRGLGRLHAERDDALRREGAQLLRQWMRELEEVDREGELDLAESCGYGELVEWYRTEVG